MKYGAKLKNNRDQRGLGVGFEKMAVSLGHAKH